MSSIIEESDFLKIIESDPSNELNHLVYADWLQENNREQEALAHRVKWIGFEENIALDDTPEQSNPIYQVQVFTSEVALKKGTLIKGLWVDWDTEKFQGIERAIERKTKANVAFYKGFYLPTAFVLNSVFNSIFRIAGDIKNKAKFHTRILSTGPYLYTHLDSKATRATRKINKNNNSIFKVSERKSLFTVKELNK
jgi:uncharacterized protein (TIGR02996 family)